MKKLDTLRDAREISATRRTERKNNFEKIIKHEAAELWKSDRGLTLNEVACILSKRVLEIACLGQLNALYKASTIKRIIKGVKTGIR